MIRSDNTVCREIAAKITPEEKALAMAYIQGAVHSHCGLHPQEPFSVRLLFGGDNRNWTDTPLQCVYLYHLNVCHDKDPANEAAKDIGWLFKRVLAEDGRRTFVPSGHTTGNEYILA